MIPVNSFSVALELVRRGYSIYRKGWNSTNLVVKLQRPDEHSKMTLPYLYIEYPNGDRCPWHASQTDILALDWEVK